MTTESQTIAARLAASPWFPVGGGVFTRDGQRVAVRESQARIEADGDAVTITVTDPDGTRREYRAVVQLVAGAALT